MHNEFLLRPEIDKLFKTYRKMIYVQLSVFNVHTNFMSLKLNSCSFTCCYNIHFNWYTCIKPLYSQAHICLIFTHTNYMLVDEKHFSFEIFSQSLFAVRATSTKNRISKSSLSSIDNRKKKLIFSQSQLLTKSTRCNNQQQSLFNVSRTDFFRRNLKTFFREGDS